VTINAAGPWIDKVSSLAGPRIPLRLRQGTHLAYDRALAPVGLILEAVDRERYVFVLPHPGGTLIGPTDLDAPPDPDALRASEDEIRYLADSARRYLPGLPPHARVVVGARPILGQSGSEKLLSREYEILDHAGQGAAGLLTAGGGKMSDFRLMAKDAVDLACARLGRALPCRTERVTLEGAELPPPPVFPRPSRPLKRFLRAHPHLRELHAWAHLAGAYFRHWGRRAGGSTPWADAAAFRSHYAQ
jgi:glycerol-3-phosphate dehydrogenase